MFLYEKIDALREYGNLAEVPEYISKNLSPKFELRPYQVQAFENFITHFENKKSPRPLQVLFHMATGSGKTLIMAGLIIYLYRQGYRNFLFFVNLTNIIDKTQENFLNSTSPKYLFADEIIIDGERIRINEVENFQSADEGAINICFDTTQGLHTKIFLPRENAVTLDDFKDKKIVLISDESHHLNVETKKGGKLDENTFTWEQTIKNIFAQNPENILLEFTATCDLKNPAIKAAYEDKIIFDYPLQKFYNDRFSKDIISLHSDLKIMDKALQAIILSQYRLKIFQANRLSIKPVILFKSAKIADSQKFMAEFLDVIKNLNGEKLRELSKICKHPMIVQAFEYFARKGITFEMLAAELRDDFSAVHCISVNDDKDAEKNQLLLNSLEAENNPYRAIFEVKKLDEGWDVLNLFDIVRLYKNSGGKKSTISEAQLIGRGSRYCPFKIDDEQEKFQRKFDSDTENELRICETLYYHCQNDSKYIAELQAALREIGLEWGKIVKKEYKLKESFKRDELFKIGVIFLNEQQKKARPATDGLSPAIREKIYDFKIGAGNSGSEKLLTEGVAQENKTEIHSVTKTVKEIAAINFGIVHTALRKYPVYKFCNLKKIFPALQSIRNFIIDEKYLGGVQIKITSNSKNPDAEILYLAVFKNLGEIAAEISKPEIEYEGTKEFFAQKISEIFKDKTVNYSATHDGGQGVSQNDSTVAADLKIDLTLEDWFAYTDNFGTSEEKAFVAYFKNQLDELKKIYSKIFLVRNERQFKIYSFDSGERFEPDYVIFLQKNNARNFEQLQIFVEPKGEHLLAKDAWKEEFLLQLKENADIEKFYVDDNKYLIWGLHFFNQGNNKNFEADFNLLTKI